MQKLRIVCKTLLTRILRTTNLAARLLYPGQRSIGPCLQDIPNKWRLSTNEVSKTATQVERLVKVTMRCYSSYEIYNETLSLCLLNSLPLNSRTVLTMASGFEGVTVRLCFRICLIVPIAPTEVASTLAASINTLVELVASFQHRSI